MTVLVLERRAMSLCIHGWGEHLKLSTQSELLGQVRLLAIYSLKERCPVSVGNDYSKHLRQRPDRWTAVHIPSSPVGPSFLPSFQERVSTIPYTLRSSCIRFSSSCYQPIQDRQGQASVQPPGLFCHLHRSALIQGPHPPCTTLSSASSCISQHLSHSGERPESRQ